MTPFISLAPRIKAKRRTICKTDESVVSRLNCIRMVKERDGSMVELLTEFDEYHGMVERLQKISTPEYLMEFNFIINDHLKHGFCPGSRMYHILKFRALRFARQIFPKNFVDAQELRIFSEKGVEYAAMYSDYVRDRNGARKRQMQARRLFNNAKDKKERSAIIKLHDDREHELTPGLAPLIDTVSEAGIVIPHPEANYHLTKDGIVFFEVTAIDLQKALKEARRIFSDFKNTSPMALLARMHAAIIRHQISREHKCIIEALQTGKQLDGRRKQMSQYYEDYMKLPFSSLCDMILLKYLTGEEGGLALEHPADVIKSSLSIGRFDSTEPFDF